MTATIQQETTEQLRYPIGRFEWGKEYSEEDLKKLIQHIEDFPSRFEKLVKGMNQAQLNSSYREGGWTVQQIIHHLFDSHVNAYVRFKLALTEDTPTIKPYNQKTWAELGDVETTNPKVSVELLVNLHNRWVNLLKSMRAEDFERRFHHPEHNHTFTLKEILAMYAWHGDHHYEHINLVKKSFAAQSTRAKKTSEAKPSARKTARKKS